MKAAPPLSRPAVDARGRLPVAVNQVRLSQRVPPEICAWAREEIPTLCARPPRRAARAAAAARWRRQRRGGGGGGSRGKARAASRRGAAGDRGGQGAPSACAWRASPSHAARATSTGSRRAARSCARTPPLRGALVHPVADMEEGGYEDFKPSTSRRRGQTRRASSTCAATPAAIRPPPRTAHAAAPLAGARVQPAPVRARAARRGLGVWSTMGPPPTRMLAHYLRGRARRRRGRARGVACTRWARRSSSTARPYPTPRACARITATRAGAPRRRPRRAAASPPAAAAAASETRRRARCRRGGTARCDGGPRRAAQRHLRRRPAARPGEATERARAGDGEQDRGLAASGGRRHWSLMQ